MNRTVSPEGVEVDEFATGFSPGVPAPTNKPYRLLFSEILIFHVILENVNDKQDSNSSNSQISPL